jgi:IS5 family transposase
VVNWNIVDGLLKELTQQIEKVKAQIWTRVEHPFHIVKNRTL